MFDDQFGGHKKRRQRRVMVCGIVSTQKKQDTPQKCIRLVEKMTISVVIDCVGKNEAER